MKTASASITARRAALVAIGAATLAGCAAPSKHWPWARPAAAAPPQPVAELRLEPAPGYTAVATIGGIEQYWQRNTLVLDLYNVAHSGAVVLRPREGHSWPVRLGVRTVPGRFAVLEVRGDQRVVIQVSPEGAGPIDLPLGPGVYSPRTERLELEWGAGR